MSETRPNLTPSRVRAALCLRQKKLSQVARAAGVSPRHLGFVVDGERPGSQRVYLALRDALGPAGWAFASGESDTLTEEGGSHAAT